MKRWKIIGLISLMVFSLLGIIWVQLIWVENAVTVRNDLFRRSVYNALQETANRIETSRQMEFYRRMMTADSLFQSEANDFIRSALNNPASGGRKAPDFSGLPFPPYSYSGESYSFRITGDGNGVTLSGDYQRWGGDSLVSEEAPEFRRGDNEVPYRIGAGMDEQLVQEWLARKSEELRRTGEQMLSEIYNWELSTGADMQLINNTLRSQLTNAGIDTPFEFAIIENGDIIDGVMGSTSERDMLASGFSVGLFSDRLIRNNTRLSVVFPKMTGFILGSMSLILGASLLFSLIIMLTFTLSMFLIIRQKKISEMKSDFINNMTHEFKTPIATISLAADTISNPKIINDQERVKHFISLIKKENRRMNKQVETILQISSLDRREMEFVFSDVDIHDIIRHSIEIIGIQVEEKKGNIFFYPEAVRPVIVGDSEHLTNLVHNLLDNANKYSEGEPEITVRTETRGDYLVLSVEDRGIGMSKSVQTRIFERFYRQASGNVHNVKGFGLGLSYVRAIVEAHEGRIEVFSEPGRGTRFEVFLPYTR
jgi:two-component system phosphate regulon sensor histidine kinase PhoR